MPVISLRDLPKFVTNRQRFLALDIGTKTVGLAISDGDYKVASPLETLNRTKFRDDAQRLLAIVDHRNVGGFIAGLPISLDGTEGPRCQSVRQFAENLLAVRDLPFAFWDERMSTAAIQRFLIGEVDMTRKRRGEVIDKLAATYILQGALDFLGQNNEPSNARPS